MMTKRLATEPKESMADHLATLREYAEKVIVQNRPLAPDEEDDKATRMRKYLGIGTSFECTRKELVMLLLNGFLKSIRGCNCFTCRSRNAAFRPRGDRPDRE